MSEFKVAIIGDAAAVRMFEGVARAATDLRPVWDDLKVRFQAAERETFASEGGASGHWRPLTQAYAAQKAVRFPGQPIMRATDLLFHSLTDALDIDIREPHTMVLGSDVRYGRYHQEGKGHNPVRRLIDLSDGELTIWGELVAEHLTSRAAEGAAA